MIGSSRSFSCGGRLLCGWGIAALSLQPAFATDFTWNNAAGGVFENPSNWSPFQFKPPVFGPPGSGEMATFDMGNAAYTVTFNASHDNWRVRLGDDAVLFNLQGQTYHLQSSTDAGITLGLGLGDQCSLTLTNGLVTGLDASIAPIAGMVSAQMIVGSGATLDLDGTLSVGKRDTGSLTIMSGGGVISPTAILGELVVTNPIPSTGNGSALLTGPGSMWTTAGTLTIGKQGAGSVICHASAAGSCGTLFLAEQAGSGGTFSLLSDGDWVVGGNAWIGGLASAAGGTATLSIDGPGATFDVNGSLTVWPGGTINLNGGSMIVHHWTPPAGAFNWTTGSLALEEGLNINPSGLFGSALSLGSGKTLTTNGVFVGNNGSGALTIAGGAVVDSNGHVHIASTAGNIGSITVDGAGSALMSNILFAIGGVSGPAGDGTLTVSNGGSVQCSMQVLVWPGSDIVLNGGSLTAPGIGVIGTLSGSGAANGQVALNGVMAPGASAGTLTMNELLMSETGELEMEIGGTSPGSGHDQIVVNGNVDLDGTLNVTLINGFTPQPGDVFTIIQSTGGGILNNFATVNLPSGLELAYGETLVVVHAPTCPADIAPAGPPSGDGAVDVNDLLVLIGAWGPCDGGCPPAGDCPADLNGDCAVDVNDLLLLIGAWGGCS